MPNATLPPGGPTRRRYPLRGDEPARQKWRGPAGAGPLGSRPVSRILSCAVIHLCRLPGPRRAGSAVLLGVAPGGVCLCTPRHRGAGALLPHHFNLACTRLSCGRAIGGVVSVALSRGFPRVGVAHRPAMWCPDFPREITLPRLRGLHAPQIYGRGCRGHVPEIRAMPRNRSEPTRARSRSSSSRSSRSSRRRRGTRRRGPATRSSQRSRIASSSVVPCGWKSLSAGRSAGSCLEARFGAQGWVWRRRTRQTFLKTPTTLPSTVASLLRIGSKSGFSAWRRTPPFSLK